MAALQIYDRRERAFVAVGDAVLAAAAAIRRPFRQRTPPAAPHRILLLRLERVGDLIMALPAITDVRAAAPRAEIDLVVGAWNEDLARAIPAVNRVRAVNPAWLARGREGATLGELLRTASGWRTPRYDLAINFEPDIRSNLMLAAAGARWTVGYRSGGGGAVLDQTLDYVPSSHTVDNARRLVAAVFGDAKVAAETALLEIPAANRQEADAMLTGAGRPLIAIHVSGGRAIKQWEPDRFAAVGRALALDHGATIVLTGARDDRPMVDHVRRAVPDRQAIDGTSTSSILTTAAILERCDMLITGDTGPMHLAAAVGTPIVAVFGPSDPRRYAPRGPRDRIVRVDLPCAPCNRIRLPPARCTGHTPDCLAFIPAERVLEAALSLLDECRRERRHVPA